MPIPLEPRTPNLQSAADATPPCPHFGPCGGCQFQHLAYPTQLARKAAQLRAVFALLNGERTSDIGQPAILRLHPSPPLAYRNRIRLTLDLVEDQLRAGYIGASQDDDQGDDQPNHRQHGAVFVPITECPIAAPILWRAAQALLALLNQDPALWLRSPWFKPDQLELFANADESCLQLTLCLRTSSKSLPSSVGPLFTLLSEALRVHIPQLVGSGIALLPPLSSMRSRRTEQPRPGPTWGSPGLTYTVAAFNGHRTSDIGQPFNYWVPRAAFFQVNRFLLPELLALVSKNHAGTLAWDLYAGVGLFSRAFAASFSHVTAVEIAEPAATALASTKLPNLRAVKATTLDFLRAALVERDRPDLIVLDPPRTGAGREVCTLLGRIAAPTLIYVSCSPEVLPADLATLTAAGYAIAELHLFDLFPQTTHIETVAVLTHNRTSGATP